MDNLASLSLWFHKIKQGKLIKGLLPILLPSVATVNCGQRPQHWRGYREVIWSLRPIQIIVYELTVHEEVALPPLKEGKIYRCYIYLDLLRIIFSVTKLTHPPLYRTFFGGSKCISWSSNHGTLFKGNNNYFCHKIALGGTKHNSNVYCVICIILH